MTTSIPLSQLQAEIRRTEDRIYDELRRLLALASVADVELRLEKAPVFSLSGSQPPADQLLLGVKLHLTL